MDATATQLTDIKFNEAKRGYDPVEVDNFLEKLGDAVVKLQEKVREANRRADEAEQRAGDAAKLVVEAEKRALDAEGQVAAGTGSADEHELGETLKKTLLLAQRTADDTVREATADADKLLTEARQKAAKLLEDATRDSAKKLAAAEETMRQRAETETADLAEKVERLEVIRGQLANDVEALEKHVDTVRAQVTASLQELLGVLDSPDKLRAPDRPVMEAPAPREPEATPPAKPAPGYAIDLDGDGAPDVVSDEAPEAPSAPVVPASARSTATPAGGSKGSGSAATPAAAPAPKPAVPTTPAPTTKPVTTASAAPTAATSPATQPSMFAEPPKPATPATPAAPAAADTASASRAGSVSVLEDTMSTELVADDLDADAPAGGAVTTPSAEGPIAASPVAVADTEDDTDDGFLDELRKAVDDDDPLGPLDDDADAAMRAFLAGDDVDADGLPKRSRFGRKR